MSLRDAYNRTRTTQPTSGFFPTQPGDPNFSRATVPSSRAQFPAAAAEYRFFQNQQAAGNRLNEAALAGQDIYSGDYDELRQIQQQGFGEKALSLGTRLLGWLDGPRQALNLFMQDMLGGEAQDGLSNPGLLDYWDALWGGIEDSEEFEGRTGLQPVSGSHTLSLMGWEEADDPLGRVVRGIGHFGLEMLTDPVNLVTGGMSGLTRKLGIAAGREVQRDAVETILPHVMNGLWGRELADQVDNPYFRKIALGLEDDVAELQTKLAKWRDEFDGDLPWDVKKEFNDWFDPDQLGTDTIPMEKFMELAIASRVGNDVTRNLAARKFGDLPEDVLEMLPAYARGGIRISVPFFQSTLAHGWMVPGTRGLGRQVISDPLRQVSQRLRKFGPYQKLADSLDSGLNALSRDRPLIKALGEGKIEQWQYYIAAPAIDALSNNGAKRIITVQLNRQWENIQKLAEEQGIDSSTLYPMIDDMLEHANLGEDAFLQLTQGPGIGQFDIPSLSSDLYDEMRGLVGYMQETFKEYHTKLSLVDPKVAERYIDGYLPRSTSQSGNDILQQLGSKGAAIPKAEIMRMQNSGSLGEGLMSRILAGYSAGGMLETKLGATRYFQERELGRLQALKLTDEAPIFMLDRNTLVHYTNELINDGLLDPSTLKTRYLPVTELNKQLEPVIRKLADQFDVVLPSKWDGKLFNENPLELMTQYVESLTDAVNLFGLMKGLKAAGLAFHHSSAYDVQDIIQNMMTHAVKRADKVQIARAGVPDEGVANVPVKWLKQTVVPSNWNEAAAGTKKINMSDTMAGSTMDDLIADVGERGVQNPIILEYTNDGRIYLADGHHRLFAAERNDLATVPVQFRNVSDAEEFAPANSLNVASFLKENKTAENLAKDIGANPKKYAFHSTEEMKGSVVSVKGLDAGGLYMDRQTTDEFVRHAKEAGQPIEAGQRRVMVFDMESLPPSVRNALERNGEIGDVRDLPIPLKPIASYDPVAGLESLVLHRTTRNVNAIDIFSETPWKQVSYSDKLMLHGLESALDISYPTMTVRKELKAVNLHLDDDSLYTIGGLWEMARMSPEKFRAKLDAGKFGPSPASAMAWKEDDAWQLADDLSEAIKKNRHYTMKVDFENGAIDVAVDPALQAGKHTKLDEVLDLAVMRLRRQLGDQPITMDFVQKVINNPNSTKEGVEVLHRFLRAQFGGLSPVTKEWLTGTAAEVADSYMLFTDFQNRWNTLTRTMAALETPSGTLLHEGVRLLGDDEFIQQWTAMQEVATKLGKRGYDEAMKLMDLSVDMTSLATNPGFINPGQLALAGPALDGMQLHTDMAKFVRNLANSSAMMYTPQGVAAAKMAANETLTWWKAMATIARPGFHIRNLLGGSWMNMLMGVGTKEMQMVSNNAIKFRNALKNVKPNVGEDVVELALKQLPADAQPLFRAMWDEDVMSGFVSSEFRRLTADEKKGRLAWLNVFDIDNFALTRGGGKVMESIEDFMRGALFAKYFDPKNPASAKVAREMVMAVHFDYTRLTPLETKIKSLVPFFVWTRNNIPRQIQLALENPRTVSKYKAMMHAMESNFGAEEAALPEGDHFSAFAAGTNYYVNPGSPFWARVMIDPDLPIRDLIEIPVPSLGGLADWGNQMLGPHVTTLFDINAQREYNDVNAPMPFVPIMKLLAAVGFYDETQDGDVRIPYWQRTLLETALPFGREIFDPITGGPTDPNRQARVGIEQGDSYVERVLKNLGANIAGAAGVKLTTPNDARGVASRSQRELQQIIEQLRMTGQLPPSQR